MIPLVAPLYRDGDLQAVHDAVSSRQLGPGAIVARFEDRFVRQFDGSAGVATTSGTVALQLALMTLDIDPDAVVLLPSYTCVALLHAIHAVGARPKLVDNAYDVSRMDFNMSFSGVESAQSESAQAIIVPHTFGVPANIASLQQFGLPIIEDCAISLGSSIEGKPVGSFGCLSMFSFGETKMISTGTGGMLVAHDDRLAARMKDISNFGALQIAQRLANPDEVRVSHRPRITSTMTDPMAALGLSQLEGLEEFIARRCSIADYYTAGLADLPIGLPIDLRPGSVFYRYMAELDPDRLSVTEFIERMASHGVEVGRGVFPALHHYLGDPDWSTSNAERCTRRLVSIPVHPSLTDGEVQVILDSIKSVLS